MEKINISLKSTPTIDINLKNKSTTINPSSTKVIVEETVVDEELSETSTNPVQNKVITQELNKKANIEDLENLSKQVNELISNEINQLKEKDNELESQITNLDSKIKNNSSKISELESNVNDISDNVQENTNKIKELEQKNLNANFIGTMEEYETANYK